MCLVKLEDLMDQKTLFIGRRKELRRLQDTKVKNDKNPIMVLVKKLYSFFPSPYLKPNLLKSLKEIQEGLFSTHTTAC